MHILGVLGGLLAVVVGGFMIARSQTDVGTAVRPLLTGIALVIGGPFVSLIAFMAGKEDQDDDDDK
jgi:hypothetical protein